MEEETETIKTTGVSKILRIGGLIGVVALIVAAIVTSMRPPSNADKVWYEEMTLGDKNAKNYFVIYSDVACPYCIAFENALVENHEELMRYLEQNDILLEVRLADFLYQYGESNPIQSRHGAVAAYCAKEEGKFWEYYDLVIAKVWNEYFVRGKEAYEDFGKLKKDYWIKIGEQAGLSDEFASCVEEDKTLPAVAEDAKKMARTASGMPYFKFNNYASGGFDLSWGWEYVLMYFEAGLKS